MEDVLELYAEPYDPKRPVVCFDERPCQLIEEKRPRLPAKPGRAERYDYEYKRNGTCNVFLFLQPLLGWRHVKVTERRTKEDFANCMKELVDEYFPEAEKIRLVLDNLNTHNPSSLYEAFPPEEARRITRKLEFHPVPKHGSWLNMVEIEISVFSNQCLGERIPLMEKIVATASIWERERNEKKATVNWRFSIAGARAKLQHLYSQI
jgi:hypothetical protein